MNFRTTFFPSIVCCFTCTWCGEFPSFICCSTCTCCGERSGCPPTSTLPAVWTVSLFLRIKSYARQNEAFSFSPYIKISQRLLLFRSNTSTFACIACFCRACCVVRRPPSGGINVWASIWTHTFFNLTVKSSFVLLHCYHFFNGLERPCYRFTWGIMLPALYPSSCP